MSSKFPAESTGEKNVKIGQYLAKIWTKYYSLVFWATLYFYMEYLRFSVIKQPASSRGGILKWIKLINALLNG